MQDILDEVKKLHFVGIGGSGMCPMAEILLGEGYEITGSDQNESDTLERIRAYGVKVYNGHDAANIGDAQAVVYTAAAKQDNPELIAAKAKGIPVLTRAVVLGMLTRRFKNAIAVSGTHGKTTTTAMITQILLQGGKDPSAVIGGKLPIIGGNGRAGKSDIMVCEACEYVDTFLQLHPAIGVILNLEADHLDYFKTLENIIASFHQFAQQSTRTLVVNGDDEEVLHAITGLDHAQIIRFGLSYENDYFPAAMNESDTACEDFTLMHQGVPICRINLKVPGEHNMMNAVAAAAVCHHLGVQGDDIATAMDEFVGVHRRFEVLGTFGGVTVADDFAHHPTELEAVLSSAAKMAFQNVWAIFQPHTYSRTFLLMDDFAKALSIPANVIFTPILAVREVNTYGVDITDLEEKVPGSCHFESFAEIAAYVTENAAPGDLILTLGGGDIYKCAHMIVEQLKTRFA